MDKKIKTKVLKIMALALEFNNTRTQNKYTGNKPTVWVEFSGHTCQLDVHISHEGWNEFAETEPRMCIYLDDNKNAEVELDAAFETLERVIMDWEGKNKAASDGNR